MMLPILDAFLQIALRRRGPEDLPDSWFLLLIAGAAYELLQGIIAAPVYASSMALARSLVLDLLLLYGFVWGLLRFTGHAPRFRRTLTAVLGTSALMTLCMLPFNYWLAQVPDPAKPALAPTIGLLAVICWSLVVNGHIFARAMSSPFVAGLAISVAYFFLNYLVFAELGPAPA
ncbi:MAG: hypothetical protein ABIX37_07910 [Gammaproteobacteria bacterium]